MFKVKFLAEKNVSLEISADTLKECLTLQRSEKFKAFSPIAFRTESGAIFCYDENIISYFVNSDEMSISELVENSGCKALYRNRQEFISEDSFTVDAGYLWKQINNHLILVNDEAFVEAEIDENVFEKII
jgi:hypothetical protein